MQDSSVSIIRDAIIASQVRCEPVVIRAQGVRLIRLERLLEEVCDDQLPIHGGGTDYWGTALTEDGEELPWTILTASNTVDEEHLLYHQSADFVFGERGEL